MYWLFLLIAIGALMRSPSNTGPTCADDALPAGVPCAFRRLGNGPVCAPASAAQPRRKPDDRSARVAPPARDQPRRARPECNNRLQSRRTVLEIAIASNGCKAMTALSVNVNKIAVLRNSRGGDEPDVLRAARTCLYAGAHGITVHPRPDQRHIRPADVLGAGRTDQRTRRRAEPRGQSVSPRRGAVTPVSLALCQRVRPAQATLVPDGDGQLTSDHGFDFGRDAERLRPLVSRAEVPWLPREPVRRCGRRGPAARP